MSPLLVGRWLLFLLAALPDRTKAEAIDLVLGRIWRSRRNLINDELQGCANYLNDVARQHDRAGRPELAAAIREATAGMVGWRNQIHDDQEPGHDVEFNDPSNTGDV